MTPLTSAPSLEALDTGGINSGPVVIYAAHDALAAVVSPRNHFMVADHAVNVSTRSWSTAGIRSISRRNSISASCSTGKPSAS